MSKVAKICKFDGCNRPSRTKGLCQAHYLQMRRKGELTPLAGEPVEQSCATPSEEDISRAWRMRLTQGRYK